MAPPLFCRVGPIENSHFVVLIIDVGYKIIQTALRAHFSDFIALLVFEIKKIALSLDSVILILITLPIIYFLL
jgi:hypothetical protein